MSSAFDLTMLPFLISLVISLVVTPLTIIVFKKMGWLIDPRKTPHPAHIHKEPVPKGGGIPIFLAVLITSLILLKLDKHLIAIILAALITLVIGIVDDIKSLSPRLRLVTNFSAMF